MPPVLKVADFSSRSYWEQRFASEVTFEWLQPSESILPVVKAELKAQQGAKILHIGSGTSNLSNHLRRLCSAHDIRYTSGDRSHSLILNLDFAPAAIDRGRCNEHEEFGHDRNGEMHWAMVDLLDWPSLKRTCSEHCNTAFDIIVEKSCTDALACGPDVQLPRGEAAPASYPEHDPQILAPPSALAIYLAAVTRPGAAWIALSFSENRFDFLEAHGDPAARKWKVERVQKILVDDGHDKTASGMTVYRPEIAHFLYVIRRMPSQEEYQ